MTDSTIAVLRRRVRSATRDLMGGLTRADAVAILLTATAAILAAVVAVRLFPHHSGNHDEAVYLQQAAMLLDGRLFLRPPVAESFRPWFFVRTADGALYPKYAPVPAAMFAVGKLLGGYRLALVGIAAGVLALTHLTVREAFDARHGALAAAFLLISPLFVVHTGVFLPYAATTLWNLLFAFAYLRADRTGSLPWAAISGSAVGIAFFSRPYTATLFAAPIIVHAAWRLFADAAAPTIPGRLDRDALTRNLVTAALGSGGVALALAYNAVVTGDPMVFPYAAFAPEDGLGFGHREILGYGREYTPTLALAANSRVVAAFLTDWVAGGPVGSLLAAAGLAALMARAVRRRVADSRRLALAGLALTVPLGNVYFWGNLNVLGVLATPGDGLLPLLGPYYHFDLLVPTAAFAAHAVVVGGERVASLARKRAPSRRHARVVLAVAVVVSATAFAVPAAMAMQDSVERNADVTAAYDVAYAPFDGRSFDSALVFLPTPYGDWLNHPFQTLRNDPRFDGDAVYALRERQFAVVDAFPNRTLYRYTYHGHWAPTIGATVEPRLQRVQHVEGDSIWMAATLGVPAGAQSVSVRLVSENGSALFAANGTADSLPLSLTVADGRATLDGSVRPVGGDASVPVRGRDTLQLIVFVSSKGAGAVKYRLDFPVLVRDDGSRALTPYAEVCTTPRLCGGESAYVPRTTADGVFVDVAVRASNTTAVNG